MKKWKVVAAVAVVLVVAGGLYLALSSPGGGVAYTLPDSSNPPPQLAAAPEPVFKETGLLKPPAGAKVAIYEFDDLECPACAHAMPIMHQAAQQYRIPIVHHDFPLTEIHTWSFDAAVTARYLQDNVSPSVADSFRSDVFSNQNGITSKDDLTVFTKRWFAAHNQTMPFVMDANGGCTREVKADRALGDRIGVHSTPCIFVVTEAGYQYVADIGQLSQIISSALQSTARLELPGHPAVRTSSVL